MLSQTDADQLMEAIKRLLDASQIQFPRHGSKMVLEAESDDPKSDFLFDINRAGRLKPTKCSFQERVFGCQVLVRLDVDGSPHENPDGTEIPCPHLHIYREGFADKWAYAVPESFQQLTDLVRTFQDFLRHCHVQSIPNIQRSID